MARQIVNAPREAVTEGLLNTADQQRLERFLSFEAALMDEHQYDAWMALWEGEDICYWVPCNDDDQDPATGIAIIYDDRRQLEERMMRLKDKTAHAYRPRARLIRSVSDVMAIRVENGELQVASSFVLGEIRVGVQNIWLGKCLYRLRDSGNEFRILSKKVMLLNNDEAMPNLTFLV